MHLVYFRLPQPSKSNCSWVTVLKLKLGGEEKCGHMTEKDTHMSSEYNLLGFFSQGGVTSKQKETLG